MELKERIDEIIELLELGIDYAPEGKERTEMGMVSDWLRFVTNQPTKYLLFSPQVFLNKMQSVKQVLELEEEFSESRT